MSGFSTEVWAVGNSHMQDLCIMLEASVWLLSDFRLEKHGIGRVQTFALVTVL